MNAPTLIEWLATIAVARAKANEKLDAIKAASPEVLKDDVQALQDEFNAAFGDLSVETVSASMSAALDVLRSGHGISGGGANASLA